MVAFLNFKGVQGGPPYRAMYDSALKFLERDVRQEVAFAVVTSFKTTLELGGNRTPNIRLYLWNETLVLTSKYVNSTKVFKYYLTSYRSIEKILLTWTASLCE